VGFEFAREWVVGGWVGGREGRQGGCMVIASCEVKNKEKNYAVFYFAGKRFVFYIYDVITSPEKGKRSSIHYLCKFLCVRGVDKHT
jgi:hypothetical protein